MGKRNRNLFNKQDEPIGRISIKGLMTREQRKREKFPLGQFSLLFP